MISQAFFSPPMAWLFAPVACLAVVSLVYCIRGLVRLLKRSRIVSVPLQAEQEVNFAEDARVVLCIEGPLFTRGFARLTYELSAPDGTIVKGRPALFRSRTSGLSTVRMESHVFALPVPGTYRLRINGLGESAAPDPRERIVFMRPHLGRSIGFIIGIVLSGGLFITGLVFTLLCFVSH